MKHMTLYVLAGACSLALTACEGVDGASLSYEEFKSSIPRDSDGTYIVEGDIPLRTENELREYYDGLQDGAVGTSRSPLIVDRRYVGGGRFVDDIWDSTTRNELSYCISDGFGSNKAAVTEAMAGAARAWESVANVHFIYKPEEDADCTSSNFDVLFNVEYVTGQRYLGMAFLPRNDRRLDRVLKIDSSAFNARGYTLLTVVTHELGHVLGFRHEFIDQNVTGECAKETDTEWARVTDYDPNSVMNYLQCNDGQSVTRLTAKDKQGAAALYGSPAFPNTSYGNEIVLRSMKTGKFICSSDGAIISCGDTVGTWEHFKLVQNGDGTVSIVAVVNTKYVTAGTAFTAKLHAGATSIDTWEKYIIITNDDGTVSFKSMRNGQYVSIPFSLDIPWNQLSAVAPAIDTWEKFTVETTWSAQPITADFLSKDLVVAFQAVKNGKYLTDVDHAIYADRDIVSTWERFRVKPNADGTVSLFSEVNRGYFSVQTWDWISTYASAVDTWEKFTYVNNSDGTVSFRSLKNGNYLTSPPGSVRLAASASALDSWEKFRMYIVGPPSGVIPGQPLKSALNERCLDIFGANADNGAQVGMWDCNGGTNQQWYWEGSQIKSRLNGRCLDIFGLNSDNGAQVGMWDCNGGTNQRWYQDGSQIRSRLNGRCLDIFGLNSNNGAQVVMWDCHGGPNQSWHN